MRTLPLESCPSTSTKVFLPSLIFFSFRNKDAETLRKKIKNYTAEKQIKIKSTKIRLITLWRNVNSQPPSD